MTTHFYLKGSDAYKIDAMSWPCERPMAVLLCLHGFAGDKYSTVIEAVAERFSAHMQVLTFDWPAHGDSKADPSMLTVDRCLEDLDTMIGYINEHYPGLPLYAFATSFGGYLLLKYHAREPEVFDRIILRSPALDMPEVVRHFMDDETYKAWEKGGTVDFGLERPLPLTIEFLRELRRHGAALGSIADSERFMIIQGDKDDVVSPDLARRFARQNGIAICMVEGADHRYKNPGDVDRILEAAVDFFEN